MNDQQIRALSIVIIVFFAVMVVMYFIRGGQIEISSSSGKSDLQIQFEQELNKHVGDRLNAAESALRSQSEAMDASAVQADSYTWHAARYNESDWASLKQNYVAYEELLAEYNSFISIMNKSMDEQGIDCTFCEHKNDAFNYTFTD